MHKILITGGSGFIGTRLTLMLKSQGYHVEHIGRSRNSKAGVKTWLYDVKRKSIENGAFNLEGFDGFYIVHLAGEGIMDKPWTDERKKSIVASRVETIKFLYEECVKRNVFPKAVVSASGISYYGTITSEKIMTETDPPSYDFIGQCCVEWEEAANLFSSHCPVACLRTPLVLDKNEGGLPMMIKPLNVGVKAIVGNGKQWLPWIHIKDLCRLYIFAIENKLTGSYNAVAPTHLTYHEMMNALCPVKKGHKFRALIQLKVPVWLVRFLYGERHKLVTTGSRASCEKLLKTRFSFHFQEIKQALEDLYLS